MAVILLLLLNRVWDPLLSTLGFLGRLGLVGCDAFKDSASEQNDVLSAINTPTSISPAPLPWSSMSVWMISSVSWFCAICHGSTASSLLSSAASLFSTLTTTFDSGARAGFAGIDGVSILCIVTSTCTLSSNWSDLPSDGCDVQCSPLNAYVHALAVRFAPLPLLRPHGPAVYFPSNSPLYPPKM